MVYLCGSAVVKFKTYQMTNGRDFQRNYEYCDSRANETQMTEKYAAEMFKWHLLKKIGSWDVN